METTKENKGLFNGSCNRTACQKPGAIWYNYSTQAYYCPDCADILNEANHLDAIISYGHELCIEGEHEDCEGCQKIFRIKDLSSKIKSIRHKHPTAHKAQKRIQAIIKFINVTRTGSPPRDQEANLCEKCQILIMQGTYSGGMWK